MFDTSKVEKIAPDYWRNSQLSIARFSSGCVINGVSYVLDHDTDYLIRFDVWQRELKDKAKAKRVADAERKRWGAVKKQLNEEEQGGLF